MTRAASICVECEKMRPMEARGLCNPCYQRLRKRGDLDRHPRRNRTPEEWFSLIDTNDPDACWLWPGTVLSNGYGRAADTGAHRWAYTKFVGPIAAGLELDHICHTNDLSCVDGSDCLHRRCVNYVNHLAPVPPRVNMERGHGVISVMNRLKTHCTKGHPYDEANTLVRRCGRRACRECNTEWCRKYKLNQRAA